MQALIFWVWVSIIVRTLIAGFLGGAIFHLFNFDFWVGAFICAGATLAYWLGVMRKD